MKSEHEKHSNHSWRFRLLAATLGPLVFLVLLDFALMILGVGYPTSFLLSSSNHGEKTYVQNNRVTWRFLGPRRGRRPYPFSILRKKPEKTTRIFVFGESAAYGDPQPEFGLPRMLQTMLSERHPGVHFEVINAAITAINSHVIRDMASDCARADGDIWVIYMGNNEVVGPYGAGTVFGRQASPLSIIRAGMMLKATSLGQFLDSIQQRLPRASGDVEWEGMQMFLGSQVRASDSRMKRIYDYFARNLEDIVRTGRKAGAGIVLTTVAVNLKDCAPFSSEHREGLRPSELESWQNAYQSGAAAQAAGNPSLAERNFRSAAEIDDSFADLRFCDGQCKLALHEVTEAQRQFRAARDLDTLRFRCDSTLNDLTRKIATLHADDRVLLADAEHVFSAMSPDGLPGTNFFYEHVHPNLEGNYLLARTVGEQVEKFLTEETSSDWASLEDCARRLGWSAYSRWEALHNIEQRLREPPFVNQINHEDQMRALANQLKTLAQAAGGPGIQNAEARCEGALTMITDDAELHYQLGVLKMIDGNVMAAADEFRQELDAIPSDSAAWGNLGLVLSEQQRFDMAAPAFGHAFDLDPLNYSLMLKLARAWQKTGRRKDAAREYRRAVAINPNFAVAWIELGQLLEEMGQHDKANGDYQRALACHTSTVIDLAEIANFCEKKNWFAAASSNYSAAIRLDPANPRLRVQAGGNLALWGCDEAAAEQFREALRLQPNLVKPRINLGVALMKLGRGAEALAEMETVLREDPDNTLATQYAQALKPKP